jgi:uncharacterized membrane protein YeaQ/YmgE (transglycosylase-associated protein family)
MMVLVWVILGLLIGTLATKRFHHSGRAFALDLALCVGGAIAGGLAFHWLVLSNAPAVAVVGSVFAAVGAVMTMVAYRAIFRPA